MGKPATRAKNKYNAKVYERIVLQVKKGNKEIITKRANELGKSVNAYIKDLINADIDGKLLWKFYWQYYTY